MTEAHIPEEMFRMTSPVSRCSYLEDEKSALTYRVYLDISPAELELLISRGWRRFTGHVFRPSCPACQKCVPIRVPVQQFQLSKSQRRVMRRNESIRYVVQKPTVTDDHIRLYNAWHDERTASRGWHRSRVNAQQYWENFLVGDYPSLHEMLFYEDDKLFGVSLIDVMPNSTSSVYFFYDPSWAPRSPGTFSGLCEIEAARQAGREYVYFGYWIGDCPSMAYKNRFQPYELLEGYPADGEEPNWVLHETSSTP